MFGVFAQGAQYRTQVGGKPITQRRSHARSAIGLREHSGVTKLKRFI
jgi:hypothetical protein